MHQNNSETWLESNLGRILFVILFAALFSVAAVLIKYYCQFSGVTISDHEKWGQFGDYVGGTLNPILSFLALMSVLITLFVQSRAMEITRKQSAQQTKVASHAAQISAIDTLIQSLNEQIAQHQNSADLSVGNVFTFQEMLCRRDELLNRLDKAYEEIVALEALS